jgi:hypothetical protein
LSSYKIPLPERGGMAIISLKNTSMVAALLLHYVFPEFIFIHNESCNPKDQQANVKIFQARNA